MRTWTGLSVLQAASLGWWGYLSVSILSSVLFSLLSVFSFVSKPQPVFCSISVFRSSKSLGWFPSSLVSVDDCHRRKGNLVTVVTVATVAFDSEWD